MSDFTELTFSFTCKVVISSRDLQFMEDNPDLSDIKQELSDTLWQHLGICCATGGEELKYKTRVMK